jgi:hypothetical protein
MDRTKAIFETVFSLPLEEGSSSSSSSALYSQACSYHKSCIKLSFESVDSGISDEIFKARSKREKKSLEQFYATSKEFKTFSCLQNWLFSKHNAYSTSRHVNGAREVLDESILKTY